MEEKRKGFGIGKNIIFISAALIVMGAVFLIYPGASAVTICNIVAGASCALGVIRLITYFNESRQQGFGSYGLVQGIALIVLGIFIFIRPEFLAAVITSIIGIAMIVSGALKLQYAIDLLRAKGKGWWMVLAAAALMVIAGLVILFNPFATFITLMIFAGITLIFDGAANIVSVIYLSKKIKEM